MKFKICIVLLFLHCTLVQASDKNAILLRVNTEVINTSLLNARGQLAKTKSDSDRTREKIVKQMTTQRILQEDEMLRMKNKRNECISACYNSLSEGLTDKRKLQQVAANLALFVTAEKEDALIVQELKNIDKALRSKYGCFGGPSSTKIDRQGQALLLVLQNAMDEIIASAPNEEQKMNEDELEQDIEQRSGTITMVHAQLLEKDNYDA